MRFAATQGSSPTDGAIPYRIAVYGLVPVLDAVAVGIRVIHVGGVRRISCRCRQVSGAKLDVVAKCVPIRVRFAGVRLIPSVIEVRREREGVPQRCKRSLVEAVACRRSCTARDFNPVGQRITIGIRNADVCGKRCQFVAVHQSVSVTVRDVRIRSQAAAEISPAVADLVGVVHTVTVGVPLSVRCAYLELNNPW